MESYFLFTIEGCRYALPLERVERVTQAVAVTPLPDGPDVVRGVVDLHGRIVPVVDLRARLGHPPRDARLDDAMVVADTSFRTVAFLADSADGVVQAPESPVVEAREVAPGLELVRGVLRQGEELVLIHDLDRVLSIEERARLSRALERGSDYD